MPYIFLKALKRAVLWPLSSTPRSIYEAICTESVKSSVQTLIPISWYSVSQNQRSWHLDANSWNVPCDRRRVSLINLTSANTLENLTQIVGSFFETNLLGQGDFLGNPRYAKPQNNAGPHDPFQIFNLFLFTRKNHILSTFLNLLFLTIHSIQSKGWNSLHLLFLVPNWLIQTVWCFFDNFHFICMVSCNNFLGSISAGISQSFSQR